MKENKLKRPDRKVILLEDKKDTVIKFLKELIEMAEKGEIRKVAVISMLEDLENKNIDTMKKEILIGFYDLSLNEKFYLLSHLQAELNYKLVEKNVDKLIEIIND